MYFLNEQVFCEKIKGKNGLIDLIAFLIINRFENHK